MADTPAVVELAKRTNLSNVEAATLIAIWQEENDINDLDSMPTMQQLKDTMKMLKEQELSLPVQVADFEKVKKALGKKACEELGLNNIVILRKDNKPAKKAGYIKSSNAELTALRIAAYLEMKNKADKQEFSDIPWLSAARRKLLYEKYLNKPLQKPTDQVAAIARLGLNAYNKTALKSRNAAAQTHLIVETREYYRLRELRKHYSPKEHADRIREVANLFTRMFDELIGISYSSREKAVNEFTEDTSEELKQFSPAPSQGLFMEERRKTQHAMLNEMASLLNPERRKDFALKDVGGPAGILDYMHKRLETVRNKYKRSDEKFVREVEKLFGVDLYQSLIDNNTSRLSVEKVAELRVELSKMIDNLDYLIQDAAPIIAENEGIEILLKADMSTVSDEDFNPNDEDQIKETWMYKYDSIDRFLDAKEEAKKLVRHLPEREEGVEKKTLFGAVKYYQAEEIVGELHIALIGVHDSPSLLAKLREMQKNFDWASDLVAALAEDDAKGGTLTTNFFRAFRLAQKEFGGLHRGSDGKMVYEAYGLEQQREEVNGMYINNIRNKVALNNSPIYDKNGNLLYSSVKSTFNTLQDIKDELGTITELSPAEAAARLEENPKVAAQLAELFKSLGLPSSAKVVTQSAGYKPTDEKYSNNLAMMVDKLDKIYSNLFAKSEAAHNSKSFYKIDKSIYKTITNNLNEIAPLFVDRAELITHMASYVYDINGERRMTHVLPTLLDNVLEALNGSVYRNLSKDSNSAAFGYETPRQYLERVYGRDRFFKIKSRSGDDVWLNKWAQDIIDGRIKEGDLKYTELLDAYGKPFEKWTSHERAQLAYDMFKQGYYRLPVTSDTQAARFIKAPKYSHDEIVKALTDVMRQEYERSVRKMHIENATFNANKNFFCFMPELNNVEFVADGKSYGKGMKGYARLLREASNADYDAATSAAIEQVLSEYVTRFNSSATIEDIDVSSDIDAYNSAIAEFVENSALAQICAIQLTAGDLAFYGDYNSQTIQDIKDGKITGWVGYRDFQKRFKQIIVPLKELDTFAPGAKRTQKCLYVNDPKIISAAYEQTRRFMKQQLKAGKITREQYDAVVHKKIGKTLFDDKGNEIGVDGSIEVTNGQAFRTLDSHIALMHALGTWTQEKEDAITRIRENRAELGDMDVYLEVQKLFSTGLVGYEGNGEYALSPFQHKCSEQVLLPPTMNSSLSATTPILGALYKLMEEKGIDTIHFVSTVKVGQNGAISLPENYRKMTEQQLLDELRESIDVAQSGSDGSIPYSPIHEIPMETVGTVTYVPEHGIDRMNAIGTQTQKVIPADIPLGTEFNINGKKYSREEVLAKYNAVWTEKIRRSYQELTGKTISTANLSRMLQDAAEASKRSNSLLDRAFELDAYGNFIVPLCNLSRLNLSSQVLNAVIRKAVGRVYTNGGQFVLATALGLENELKVRYDEDADGTLHLKCIDCAMPVTSFKMVEQYVKKNKDGEMMLDINDIPEELREVLGYRIPTQGKNFIAPLRIVKLLPQLTGSVIIVAPDVEWLSDSDYDVDKEYIMLPSYERVKGGKFRKVRYDMDGNVSSMSDGALNNMTIDLMRSILTNDNVSGQTINSGDTEPVNKVARDIMSLRGMSDIQRSPASIIDVIEQEVQNNDGKEMIAAMAASNSSHALAQHSNPKQDPKAGLRLRQKISMFGKEAQSLSMQKHPDEEMFISANLGACIGAATDNAKNPVLYWMNINSKTVGVATLMIRLGYSLEEVALFLNIPSIREYSRSDDPDSVLTRYDIAKYDESTQFFSSLEEARAAIRGEMGTEYLVAALRMFQTLNKISNELFTIDSLTKNDTGSGVPHGDISSNVARMLRYYGFLNKKDSTRRIDGWQSMFSAVDTNFEKAWSDKDFREAVKNSNVPIAQAFTSYAFFGGYRMFQRFIPLIGDQKFISLASEVLGERPKEEDVRQFLWAAMQYSQADFDCWKHKKDNAEDSHAWYMEVFPKEAAELIKEFPELANNALYRDLRFGNEDVEEYPFIDLAFRTEEGNEMYTKAWLDLLYHSNEKVRQFARDLYIYGYHRNGFVPRMNKSQRIYRTNRSRRGNFGYLAPIEVMESIPGLLSETGDIRRINAKFSNDAENFAVIFLRNNLDKIKSKPAYASLPQGYEEGQQTIDIEDMPLGNGKYSWYYTSGKPRKSFAIEIEKKNKQGQRTGTKTYYYVRDEGGIYHLVESLGWTTRANEYRKLANPFSDAGYYRTNFDIEQIEEDLISARNEEEQESDEPASESGVESSEPQPNRSTYTLDDYVDATGKRLCE